MKTGRIVEFDEPHALLQKPDGALRKMIKALGSNELDKLSQIAADKFHSK